MSFSQRKLRENTIISEINKAIDMAAYGMAYYENLKLINTIKNVKNNMDGYKADIKWSELGFAPALPNAMYYAENAI